MNFEIRNPFSDADISNIEEALGRKIPQDYIKFVKEYGNPRVEGRVDGSPDFPIDFFSSAEDLISSIKMYSELTEEGAFAFGDCFMGNRFIIDHDDTVHYIDDYSDEPSIHQVGDNFQDFLDRLVEVVRGEDGEEYDEEDEEDEGKRK